MRTDSLRLSGAIATISLTSAVIQVSESGKILSRSITFKFRSKNSGEMAISYDDLKFFVIIGD